MKKTYVKPQIAYESFQLSTSIASSCDLFGAVSAPYICPVADEELGLNYFAESTSLCDTAPVNANICYDVSGAGWTVFSS